MSSVSSLAPISSRLIISFLLSALVALPLAAAQPATGNIDSTTTTPITWVGTSPGGSSAQAETTCVEGVNCETFTITVNGTVNDWAGKAASVRINWLLPATDYDIYIHQGSLTGPESDHSGDGLTTSEDALIVPSRDGVGTFVVHVVYFAATAADQYHGTIDVVPSPFVDPGIATADAPSYRNYAAPAPLGKDAGEPSIGISKSGKAFFLAGLETLRITFDDNDPNAATWVDKSALNTSIESFDPILFTDPGTGRTFVSQLLPTKMSLMSFTDDDGETWTPSQGSGLNSGVDHQTIGGGPFKPGITGRGPLGSYPNAIYYASQDDGLASIALSQDGGQTFGVAVPMWNLLQCGGLHGHIKVAPDGTVYVPNKSCFSGQGFAVSEDNGLTWNLRTVPGSISGDTDPSIGIATDGTVYFGFSNGGGKAMMAVTHDRGLTWQNIQDVGISQGINNTVFAQVTAGDSDRAAFFFLGSKTAGASGLSTDRTFEGVWHGYMATTFDGGRSWVTQNATPGDPVQRGVICTEGTGCPSGTRNLLDFNDLQIDAKGRPHAAFADGCITANCINGVDWNGASTSPTGGTSGVPDGKVNGYDNDLTKRATIVRQIGGKTLYAKYDIPEAPTYLQASYAKPNVKLTWLDHSKSEQQFVIERSTNDESHFATLATVGVNATSYTDTTAQKKTIYFYRVRAVNANGASGWSNSARVYTK
ncbi:MAG: hypothetical protein QOI24_2352 [Acidobacteriota bacterium]|jgi:hypothetical protein|nr:hypothetical protein [Acidobacteriota bacterium]